MNVFEADIVATGSELTYGQLVDTNSSWVADQLTQWGGIVRRITIVGDKVDDIASALVTGLREKRKLIVVTGGLGPTEDDLTVEAIANALGRKIILDEKAIAMVKAKCDEYRIELTDRRKRMARTVEGASLLRNPVGFSPGTSVQIGETVIVSLPGIPEEMKAMFEAEVLPIVRQWAKGRMNALNVKVFCGNERFTIFRQVQDEFPEVYLKFHAQAPSHDPRAHTDGVEVVLLASGPNEQACKTELEKVVKRLLILLQERGGKLEIKNSGSTGPTSPTRA